ncbi:MAG: DUF1847 domain-containing protein [Peptococcaceae bacterium]|nr:DUF1847 domain-containing protein [Peptococcaceae bacterium]
MAAEHNTYGCNYCKSAASFKGDYAKMPKTCPTLTHAELTKEVSGYLVEPYRSIMQVADQTPFDANRVLRNRVEELIVYLKALGLKRVGIAFCVTLLKETQNLIKYLHQEGLDSIAVCCRVGAVDYTEIGLTKAHPDKFAAICNPLAQSKLLNQADVDIVVQMGLCLGHDIILQQQCTAPVTTLVVKDRALDHHSVLALR